jgi:molybdopterin-guanine dinucleotide biosynthesis protein A
VQARLNELTEKYLMNQNLTAVILAGGASTRFNGRIKAKIVIDGKTIISRILDTLGEIFDDMIIVTNDPEEFIEYNHCKIIGDLFLNKGPLGGIHAAMKASGRDALFVVAGDMPLLDKNIITLQTEFFINNKCDILIPQINNNIEPLHGIYNRSLVGILEAYLQQSDNYAIREFLKLADVRYLLIEDSVRARNAFININSPDDILAARKLPDD